MERPLVAFSIHPPCRQGVGDPLGFQRGLQALETADVEEST